MTATPSTYSELKTTLARAHRMSISGESSSATSTLYGASAAAIEDLSNSLAKAHQELRDFRTAREAAEAKAWSVIISEDALYPDTFELQATTTGAGFNGRQSGDKIYVRNFESVLLPTPGTIYKNSETGTLYLVIHVESYETSAVIHTAVYEGEVPEAKVR